MQGWGVVVFILLVFQANAQIAPRYYGVTFTDKNFSPYSLSQPSEFLSQRCLQRRQRFHIPIDSLDLPVNPAYIDAVLQFGSATVKYASRWFNGVVLFVLDTTVIAQIQQLPMVQGVKMLPLVVRESDSLDKWSLEIPSRELPDWNLTSDVESYYGPSYHQAAMMNGPLLHAMGYTGEGMHIAILDAGWTNAQVLSTFDKVRHDHRILGTRDFVFELNDPVNHSSSHGTYVWSIMAGHSPGQLIGTAHDASYYLLRTENPGSEHLAEEWNWVAGAEFADSVGVDVINSSLGYSLFDWESENHTFQDMDGQTTLASRGADIAAAKGILVVNSAGNSGDDPWRYITAPSDGDSVLCIGATWPDRSVAWFSSRGPSADGDVKPNVSAQGVGVVFAGIDSTFSAGNGTSFSSPLVAGLAACLWQAFPDLNNMQILHAIENSAHLYDNPNDDLGYGVPDFFKAYQVLATMQPDNSALEATLWPNPSQGQCTIHLTNWDVSRVSYELYDAVGQRIFDSQGAFELQNQGILRLDMRHTMLRAGLYFVHLESGDRHSVIPWMIDP